MLHRLSHRIRSKFFGSRPWRFVFRRILYHLTHPGLLSRRLGLVTIKGVPVRYWLYAIFYYFSHPSLIYKRIYGRLRRIAVLRRLLGYLPLSETAEDTAFASGHASDPRRARILANEHVISALKMVSKTPTALPAATELLQKAFSLSPNPTVAIHLANALILTNRNQEALCIYRDAFRACPKNPQLRQYYLAQALRHSGAGDVTACIDELLEHSPADPTIQAIKNLYQGFPARAAALRARIEKSANKGKPLLFIGVAAWDQHHIEMFAKYLLASLLAEGNLPGLRERFDIHLILFTTERDVRSLEKIPQFQQSSEFLTFQMELFDDSQSVLMKNSDSDATPLGKFVLMSGSHYLTIEAARQLDALVSIFGADNLVSSNYLTNAIAVLKDSFDAVATPGFRLDGDQAIPAIEAAFRSSDGRISISDADFARLVVDYLPREIFVDSKEFTMFPLFMAWRTDRHGIVVRANHCMPCLIRAAALPGPIELSIDPVDGRFLSRMGVSPDHIALPVAGEIGLVDLSDNPLVMHTPQRDPKFTVEKVAAWLLCYSDKLRERYFRHDFVYQSFPNADGASETRQKADMTVNRILNRMHALEAAIKATDTFEEREASGEPPIPQP